MVATMPTPVGKRQVFKQANLRALQQHRYVLTQLYCVVVCQMELRKRQTFVGELFGEAINRMLIPTRMHNAKLACFNPKRQASIQSIHSRYSLPVGSSSFKKASCCCRLCLPTARDECEGSLQGCPHPAWHSKLR